MKAKDIYDRRKRLKAERLLRAEEEQRYRDQYQDEGEILIACIAASLESIAESLAKIAAREATE